MNFSFNSSVAVFNPYSQPLDFCGVVEGAVQSHYQGLLSAYWGLFLLGGFVVGFLCGFIATVWWLNRDVKK